MRMGWLWIWALLALPAQAPAGWENGNAGDIYSAEFILTGRDLFQRLKLLPASELTGIDLNRFYGAVMNTKVHSDEYVELNGYEVDAKNLPETGEIILNRSRWRPLRAESETRQRFLLVLHEYLWVAGVEDPQFRVSGRLMSQLTVIDYNPNRWWNPLNPANHLSLRLDYAPNNCVLSGMDFNTQAAEEQFSVEAKGECGEAYRKVEVTKHSFTAPPSTGARGTFHRYDVRVFDRGGLVGALTYEPDWGVCVLPQDGSCRLGGKIYAGGVELNFWLLR